MLPLVKASIAGVRESAGKVSGCGAKRSAACSGSAPGKTRPDTNTRGILRRGTREPQQACVPGSYEGAHGIHAQTLVKMLTACCWVDKGRHDSQPECSGNNLIKLG